MNNEPPEILTASQAAQVLGYSSVQGILMLARKGKLPRVFTPLSKRPRYRRSDVMSLITTQVPDAPLYNKKRDKAGQEVPA